jgi:SNF2 family DNA or RNA helicase
MVGEGEGEVIISFPYDAGLVTALKKEITKRKWNKEKKYWTCDIREYHGIMKLALEYGFTVEESALQRIKQAQAAETASVTASKATDSDDFDEIGELELGGGILRPFQKAGVRYALAHERVLIADEMGLGKTVQALATLQAAQAFPALVVCPASLKLNWKREAQRWLPGKTISVMNGQDEGHPADVTIVNYDILDRFKNGQGGGGGNLKGLIFDEAHYLKNPKAKRTVTAKEITASKGASIVLMLTGTPVLNRPKELISLLAILGRLEKDFGGFWQFAKRYCLAHKTRWGWDMEGAGNLQELNTKLRACCYLRREKREVLKELLPKQRVVVPLELSNRREYDSASQDLISYLRKQSMEDESFLKTLAALPEDERRKAMIHHADSAEYRARQAEHLVRIEALKQCLVRGKREGIVEWVTNFLDSDQKLVLFAHHREVVEDLASHFDSPKITGDTPILKRDEAVRRFQEDEACKLIVLNMQAGGVGLTLTAASNVAFLELPWRPADLDQAEDRCHRIGQHDQVTAWYLLGEEDTIDNEIWKLIDEKRSVVDAVTQGDGTSVSPAPGIMKELVGRLLAKKSGEKEEERIT